MCEVRPKKWVVLTVLVCGLQFLALTLHADPLDFNDLMKDRNTEQSTENQLYRRLFLKKADTEINREIWQATYLRETINMTSSSLTTQHRLLKSKESSGKDIAKFIWKAFSKELKNELKTQIAEWDKTSSQGFSAIPPVSPMVISTSTHPINKIHPTLKFGSDYVKPELTVNNSFGLRIDIGASYHTGEHLFETKLLKEFTSDLQFTIQNMHRFEKEMRSDHLIGFQLEF